MPDDRPALSIVIPARNEAAAIRQVLDDASTDATPALVAESAARHGGVRLLRHEERRGIAVTTHDGLTAARYDVICYLDGDGQCAAHEFAPMHHPRRGGVASGGGLGLAARQFVDLARYVVARRRAPDHGRRHGRPGDGGQHRG